MPPSLPATLADFKARFNRDFQYGTGLDKVTDIDIDNAMTDAASMFNPSLFNTADGKLAFLFATAHFVCSNVQAAGGLSVGPTKGLGIGNVPQEIQTNAGVGGVSAGFLEPPDIVKMNPSLFQFWSTDYGRRYMGMLVPKLRGAFGVVLGRSEIDTRPGSTPNVPFVENS